MKSSNVSEKSYIIRLEKGEEIIKSVSKFCATNNIRNAGISGIGSVENPKLAHYRMDKKKYSEKQLKGIFEIVNMTGNVALFDDSPLVHIHAVVSDDSMKAMGGHLVEGKCSATVEIVLEKFNTAHRKHHDKKVGLALWDV